VLQNWLTEFASSVTPASQLQTARTQADENKIVCGSRTCKPNSVCRCRQDGHSSGPRITAWLKRPTRRLWRAEPARVPASPKACRESLPIWSCSVWGLPCPAHYCSGGALLPHLFTLTWALRPGRYIFCGTFRRTIPPIKARGPSRTLSGTLLCGVRTFLPSRDERPSGPAANLFIIVHGGFGVVAAHAEWRSSQFPVLSSQLEQFESPDPDGDRTRRC
jgi:hypothetical protein